MGVVKKAFDNVTLDEYLKTIDSLRNSSAGRLSRLTGLFKEQDSL